MTDSERFDYNWFQPDCKNNCHRVGKTDCAPRDFACMCEDWSYVYAGLCCVRSKCGSQGVFTAVHYVQRVCDEYDAHAPNMLDLNCITTTTSSKISSSTATADTATITAASEPTTSADDSGSKNESNDNGVNVPTIAGIVGGAVALVLIMAALYLFGWRKRRNTKAAHARDAVAPPPRKESLPEAVKLSELSSRQPSTPSIHSHHNQGAFARPNLDDPYHAQQPVGHSPLDYNYSSELGTSGATPHGYEMAGNPPPLPAQAELQGISFATRNQWPTELPSHHPYQR